VDRDPAAPPCDQTAKKGGYERTIDTHIKNLRKKIATIIPDRQLVSTVYGLGYKLIEAEEERRT